MNGQDSGIGADRPLLSGLTGIRAIAAGWVVLNHFGPDMIRALPALAPLRPWFRGGFLGVEIFFVLSGFIIAYNYAARFEKGVTRTQYRQFIELRIARIYPVHLVTLLFMALLAVAASTAHVRLNDADHYTFLNFVGNLFMLQGLPGCTGFNEVAWSITWEFAAYLAFPCLAVYLARVRRPAQAAQLTLAVLVVGTAAMVLLLPASGDSATAPGIMALRIATEFIAGALLYTLWRAWKRSVQSARFWDVVALIAAALILLLIGPTHGLAYGLVAVPAVALFVLAVTGASGPLGALLATRPLEWGGRISYSIYMTHFIVLVLSHKTLPVSRLSSLGTASGTLYVVGCMAAVLVAGVASYYVVEEPGRKLVRRLIGRAAHQPVAAPPEYQH